MFSISLTSRKLMRGNSPVGNTSLQPYNLHEKHQILLIVPAGLHHKSFGAERWLPQV